MAEESSGRPGCPHMTTGACSPCQRMAEIAEIMEAAGNRGTFLSLTQNETKRIYKLATGKSVKSRNTR